MTEITLSIVSHGHGPLLHALLSDLAALPASDTMRILVTLNLAVESFDPKQYPTLRIDVTRNGRPRGFGANHNAAFGRCMTPWFVVLNPDIRLPEDPFQALLRAGQRLPDVSLFSPAVTSSNGQPEDHVRRNLTLPSLWRRRRHGATEVADATYPCRSPGSFYWIAGMFMFFRTEAFRNIGGFDERYFLYCEDYDICARLYAAGYGLALVADARAIHDAQRDSQRSMRHLRWHLSSLLKVWTSRSFWTVVARA